MFKRLIYNLFNKLQRQAIDYKIKETLKRLNIPSSVKVYNSEINGNVKIDEYTYIAPWSVVSSGENSKVTIDKHCAIGRYVSITSRGHSLEVPTSTEEHNGHDRVEEDVVIGNYVWIGDHAFIKHGVTVGDYAIIGAGAVVINDVKPFEIVGGIPAKHIRFNEDHYRFNLEKNEIE